MGIKDFASVIYNCKNHQFMPQFDRSKKKGYDEQIDPKYIKMLSKLSDKERHTMLYDMASNYGSPNALLEVYYFEEAVNPDKELVTNYIHHRVHKRSEIIKVTYDESEMDFCPNIGYAEIMKAIYEWNPAKFEDGIPDNEITNKFREIYDSGLRIWIRNWTPEEYELYSTNGKWSDTISDLELLYISIAFSLPYENKTRGEIYESIKKEVYSRYY
jgi:hypothetical protein